MTFAMWRPPLPSLTLKYQHFILLVTIIMHYRFQKRTRFIGDYSAIPHPSSNCHNAFPLVTVEREPSMVVQRQVASLAVLAVFSSTDEFRLSPRIICFRIRLSSCVLWEKLSASVMSFRAMLANLRVCKCRWWWRWCQLLTGIAQIVDTHGWRKAVGSVK